uniref:Uncharacterized protein n=1 Tax=Aegilops tauschii subsp. strangulata TaxID=200361 RepID=A0A453NT75_AEGTS
MNNMRKWSGNRNRMENRVNGSDQRHELLNFPYYISPRMEYLYPALANGIRKALFHPIPRPGQPKYIVNGA